MTAVLTAIFMCGLALLSFWRLSPMHPAQLWTAPWAVASVLFALRLLPYRGLSIAAAVLLCAGCAAFVAGAVLGGRGASRRAVVQPDETRSLVTAACLASIGGAVLLCTFLAQATSEFGLQAALLPSPPVRGAIESGSYAVTIKYVYFSLAAAALLAFAAGRATTRRSRRPLAAAAAVLAALTFFSTGRATIISAAVIVLITFALARRREVGKPAFLAGIGFAAGLSILVLVGGGLIIGKTYESNAALRTTPSWFSEHDRVSVLALPYQYATSPLAAFDVLVRAARPLGTTHGCATLTLACRALAQVGLPVKPVPAVRPFTAEPLRWNTYTALDLPLLDGGWLLVAPLLSIIGYLIGRLWRRARAGDPLAILGYGTSAAALISSSGSFNFLAPHLVGAVLIAIVCLRAGERLVVRAAAVRVRARR